MGGLKSRHIFSAAAVAAAVLIIFCAVNIQERKKEENKGIKIGVSVYKSNDAFVAEIVKYMEESAREYEQETGVKINLDVSAAKSSQRTQNEQIKRYISLGYDVICVNIVDRTDASSIIDSATAEGIPIVFFNREPVYEDILRGENIYYVGTDAKSTALLQAQMLIDIYGADPLSLDKNGDGKLQYVMLEGETGHQDAIIRTDWSVQTVANHGITMEKLTGGAADWDKNQAAALMEQWIGTYGKSIEVVLCNNDEMALGAVNALEAAGMEETAVFGIDATEEGAEAVKDGRLLGTVNCNASYQGESIFGLAVSLGRYGRPPEDLPITDGRYIRSPIEIVKQ